MSKQEQQYEITTFDQLVNVVNDENIDRISIDLLMWLKITNDTFNSIKKRHPDLAEKKNSEISKVGFIWIDDHKHEIKGIQLTENSTGKVTIIDPKKKKRK